MTGGCRQLANKRTKEIMWNQQNGRPVYAQTEIASRQIQTTLQEESQLKISHVVGSLQPLVTKPVW